MMYRDTLREGTRNRFPLEGRHVDGKLPSSTDDQRVQQLKSIDRYTCCYVSELLLNNSNVANDNRYLSSYQ